MDKIEKIRCKSLEEAAELWIAGVFLAYTVPDSTVKQLREIVEKTFIAGAEWQKEQDEMSKVNYEGARATYDSTVQHLQEKMDEKYELGKKDMKEQMLKDAVEGIARPDDCEIWVNLVGYSYKFRDGEKVHIIVCKKEEE